MLHGTKDQYNRLDSLFITLLGENNGLFYDTLYFSKWRAEIGEAGRKYNPPNFQSVHLDIHILKIPMDSLNNYIFKFKEFKAYVMGYTEASEIDDLLNKVGFFHSKYLDAHFTSGIDRNSKRRTYCYIKTKTKYLSFQMKER